MAAAFFGWWILDHISLRDRVTTLESDQATNARQDAELVNLRRTLQDMIMFVRFEADEVPHHVHAEEPVPAPEPEVADAEPPSEIPDDEQEFRATQSTLESLLRERGLEPTQKVTPGQRPRE